MNQIIQKAIKGGYRKPSWISGLNWAIIFTDDESQQKHSNISRIVLDPSFWQALGKACGWNDEEMLGEDLACPIHGYESIAMSDIEEGHGGIYYCDLCPALSSGDENPELIQKWLYNALRFHEINLTEGWDAAVSYLENLINPTPR